MAQPRALVIGSTGQLGRALCAALRPDAEVVEAVRQAPGPGQVMVDLADPAAAAATVQMVRPSWVVIAGAFCNVNRAETERALCFRVNAEGPGAVAAAAGQVGAVVVHYSTDSVFDGRRALYTEADAICPVNAYSESKAAGEEAVRAARPGEHLLIRTSGMFGPDERRRNFVLRLVDELRAGKAVPVPDDQWGNPTYSEDLAGATRQLLAQGARGVYHAVGPEHLSRIELARRICDAFGLDPRQVTPVATAALGQAARRPLRLRLSTDKLSAAGVGAFRPVSEALAALRRWADLQAVAA